MEIKTLYNIGDNVFYFYQNKIQLGIVGAIKIKFDLMAIPVTQIRYRVKGEIDSYPSEQVWVDEGRLFKTKSELINSL